MTEQELTARDALYQRVAKLIGYPGHWFNPSAFAAGEAVMLNYIYAQGWKLEIEPSEGGVFCCICDRVSPHHPWVTRVEIVRPTRPEAIARAIESMETGNG